MGTKYYRIHCSFIGEMSIVYPSYPVRAAKPSPAKRFAVAAFTAVPNPANPRPDPRENPEPKEMPPLVRLVGERRRRTKFCTPPSNSTQRRGPAAPSSALSSLQNCGKEVKQAVAV